MSAAATRGLAELSRLFRLEPWYVGMDGRRHGTDPEAALLVLRALGAELGSGRDVRAALRRRRHELDARSVQPVHVAWDGSLPLLPLRLPHDGVVSVAVRLHLESGAIDERRRPAEPLERRARHGWRATHGIRFEQRLPLGYHTISIDTRDGTCETFVIAAPLHAHAPAGTRDWGVFIPLYALHSEASRGIGDFGDLETLARWAGSLGAAYVSTLPLLATFLDAPFDPSPYAPASRLFWNELFVDVTAVPGWTGGDPADAAEVDACRAGPHVDYRRVAALRRRDLERTLRTAGTAAEAAVRSFAAAHARAIDYARFRAVCDRRREGWHVWPGRLRDGDIRDGDYAPDDVEYHLYAQAQAEQQLARVAAARLHGGAALYLDMPLGVHPDSYDMWRFRDLFATGVAAGAPPDPLFTGGQNWGFRPLHPAPLREQRYGYFIEALRHHLRHARMLRLDHVMGLHRLFWIPDGMPATRGVYVRYPEEELFALLVLESARHRSIIVGEDLGTVPPAVRRTMRRHHVHRMHVLQFEASPDHEPPVAPPDADVVASLNTHDMPTFAGFWNGAEIDDQLDLGLIDEEGHAEALERRAKLRRRLARLAGSADAGPADVRDHLLRDLAGSPARHVLITLEDMWLETSPQNVPGTSAERRNWTRRARLALSDITGGPHRRRVLMDIDRRRHDHDGHGHD